MHDNWVFFNWNIKMFTLSSSSFIPDSDGGSHMETVRVITHTILGEVSRRSKLWSLRNSQCSVSRLTIVPEIQTLQGTQSLCWTGNLDHSFPTHNATMSLCQHTNAYLLSPPNSHPALLCLLLDFRYLRQRGKPNKSCGGRKQLSQEKTSGDVVHRGVGNYAGRGWSAVF